MRQGWAKNAVVYILIVGALVALFYSLISPSDNATLDTPHIALGTCQRIE